MRSGFFRLAGLLLASCIFFGQASRAQEAAGQSGHPPFLYVTVATAGQIVEEGEGTYALVVAKQDIQHVLEISEDPFELENTISGARILSTWGESASRFGEGVTMAGSIVGASKRLAHVNISSIDRTAEAIRYVFHLDKHAPLDLEAFGSLQSLTIVNYCCHAYGGSGDWLWGRE